MPYIKEPKRIPLPLRIMVWISEKTVGKRLDVARLLTWYPKAAIGSGIMEMLVAHKSGRLTERVLQLIRMQVSFMASCPFCIDMNSHEFRKHAITDNEIEALQGIKECESVESFSSLEVLALKYTKALTRTPITVSQELLDAVLNYFTEKELVVIASTIGQVNFWTRTIQGLGVQPAGFSAECSVLNIDAYRTVKY